MAENEKKIFEADVSRYIAENGEFFKDDAVDKDKDKINIASEEIVSGRDEKQKSLYNRYLSKVLNLSNGGEISDILGEIFDSEVSGYEVWTEQNLLDKASEIEQIYIGISSLPDEAFAHALIQMKQMSNISMTSLETLRNNAMIFYENQRQAINSNAGIRNYSKSESRDTQFDAIMNEILKSKDFNMSKVDSQRVQIFQREYANKIDNYVHKPKSLEEIERENTIKRLESIYDQSFAETDDSLDSLIKYHNYICEEIRSGKSWGKDMVDIYIIERAYTNLDRADKDPAMALKCIADLLRIETSDSTIKHIISRLITQYGKLSKEQIFNIDRSVNLEKLNDRLKATAAGVLSDAVDRRNSISIDDIRAVFSKKYVDRDELKEEIKAQATIANIMEFVKKAKTVEERDSILANEILSNERRIRAFRKYANTRHNDDSIFDLIGSSELFVEPALLMLEEIEMFERNGSLEMDTIDAMLFAGAYAYIPKHLIPKDKQQMFEEKMKCAIEQFESILGGTEEYFKDGRIIDFEKFERDFGLMQKEVNYKGGASTAKGVLFECGLSMGSKVHSKEGVSYLDTIKNSGRGAVLKYNEIVDALKRGLSQKSLIEKLAQEYKSNPQVPMIDMMQYLYQKNPDMLVQFVDELNLIINREALVERGATDKLDIKFLNEFNESTSEVLGTNPFIRNYIMNVLEKEDISNMSNVEKARRIAQIYSLANNGFLLGKRKENVQFILTPEEAKLVSKYSEGLENTDILDSGLWRNTQIYKGVVSLPNLEKFLIENGVLKNGESLSLPKMRLDVNKYVEKKSKSEGTFVLFKKDFEKNMPASNKKKYEYIIKKIEEILSIKDETLRNRLLLEVKENPDVVERCPDIMKRIYSHYNQLLYAENLKFHSSSLEIRLDEKRKKLAKFMGKYDKDAKTEIDMQYKSPDKMHLDRVLSVNEKNEIVDDKIAMFQKRTFEIKEDHEKPGRKPIPDEDLNIIFNCLNTAKRSIFMENVNFAGRLSMREPIAKLKILLEMSNKYWGKDGEKDVEKDRANNFGLIVHIEDIAKFWAEEMKIDIFVDNPNKPGHVYKDSIDFDKVERLAREYEVDDKYIETFKKYVKLQPEDREKQKEDDDKNEEPYVNDEIDQEEVKRLSIRVDQMTCFLDGNRKKLMKTIESNLEDDMLKNPRIVELYLESQKSLPDGERNDDVIEAVENLIRNSEKIKEKYSNKEYLYKNFNTVSFVNELHYLEKSYGDDTEEFQLRRWAKLIEKNRENPTVIKDMFIVEGEKLNTQYMDVDLLNKIALVRQPLRGYEAEEKYYTNILNSIENENMIPLNISNTLMYLLAINKGKQRIPDSALLIVAKLSEKCNLKMEDFVTGSGLFKEDKILKYHSDVLKSQKSIGVTIENVPETLAEYFQKARQDMQSSTKLKPKDKEDEEMEK